MVRLEVLEEADPARDEGRQHEESGRQTERIVGGYSLRVGRFADEGRAARGAIRGAGAEFGGPPPLLGGRPGGAGGARLDGD